MRTQSLLLSLVLIVVATDASAAWKCNRKIVLAGLLATGGVINLALMPSAELLEEQKHNVTSIQDYDEVERRVQRLFSDELGELAENGDLVDTVAIQTGSATEYHPTEMQPVPRTFWQRYFYRPNTLRTPKVVDVKHLAIYVVIGTFEKDGLKTTKIMFVQGNEKDASSDSHFAWVRRRKTEVDLPAGYGQEDIAVFLEKTKGKTYEEVRVVPGYTGSENPTEYYLIGIKKDDAGTTETFLLTPRGDNKGELEELEPEIFGNIS